MSSWSTTPKRTDPVDSQRKRISPRGVHGVDKKPKPRFFGIFGRRDHGGKIDLKCKETALPEAVFGSQTRKSPWAMVHHLAGGRCIGIPPKLASHRAGHCTTSVRLTAGKVYCIDVAANFFAPLRGMVCVDSPDRPATCVGKLAGGDRDEDWMPEPGWHWKRQRMEGF